MSVFGVNQKGAPLHLDPEKANELFDIIVPR
jgi:hypothetical protein